MDIWLWAVIGILILVNAVLTVRIFYLKKAAREIEESFAERLITDTNTLIDVSTSDRHMRKLAASINVQLRRLRSERHRFQQGDTELKNAVTNISHDLRTPLTAIFGYLELLEQEENSEAACRYLSIIRNRCEMPKQLTEELFRYSMILTTEEKLILEPVVLGHALEESIAAFYTALKERGITPEIQMPEQKVIRMLDASALSRVLSNLLNNSLKYSDGDLHITLTEAGEIQFSNMASSLDEVQVGRLFDRFYTVETARNSTGLGLAIARTLVEQMGGSISASFKNQRLCICIVFLP